MKKREYEIIEVFNKNGKHIEDVLKDIFINYIKKEINIQNNLRNSK